MDLGFREGLTLAEKIFVSAVLFVSVLVSYLSQRVNRQRNQETREMVDRFYRNQAGLTARNRELVMLMLVILEHMKSPMCMWNEKTWLIAEIEKELNIRGGRLQ